VTPTQPPTPRSPADRPDGELSMNGYARWTLPAIAPALEQVTYVRHQTRLVLRLWRLTDLLTAVEVLISELATNVVRHARTLFTVAATWDGGTLRIEVTDGSPLTPRLQLAAHPDSEGGRGLLLVDTIATDWGVDLYSQGKTIWCTIGRDASATW
jgi:anti-sigma regulatory factor (Ser/Thr protein kinase)